MEEWTIERLTRVVKDPDMHSGIEVFVKNAWDKNNVKGIKEVTGIDVSALVKGKIAKKGVTVMRDV